MLFVPRGIVWGPGVEMGRVGPGVAWYLKPVRWLQLAYTWW